MMKQFIQSAYYLSVGITLILVILNYGTKSIDVQDAFVVLCCSVVLLLSTAYDNQKNLIEGKLFNISKEESPVNFTTAIVLRYIFGIIIFVWCLFRLLA